MLDPENRHAFRLAPVNVWTAAEFNPPHFHIPFDAGCEYQCCGKARIIRRTSGSEA
jgi:hypothetical protein